MLKAKRLNTIKTTEVPGQGRRYNLVGSIQAYIQYLSDKAYGKAKSEKEAELKEQKLQAEIALKELSGGFKYSSAPLMYSLQVYFRVRSRLEVQDP